MPLRSVRLASFLAVLASLVGCGGAATGRSTTPVRTEQVDMEEMHITARRGDTGDLQFESVDAESLFRQATELLNRGRCADGVVLYDRVANEFPTSRYVSPALYNAGLCLLDHESYTEAEDHFRTLIERSPEAPDVKDAQFQRAGILVKLERFADALAAADALLTRTDLNPDERCEAMARRAQALFGAGSLDDAERQAQETLTYYRTRPDDAPVRDNFFAAGANFVLGEVFRTRSQRVEIPQAAVEEQRRVLNDRAALLLRAQTEYFNTMRFSDPVWSSAAGYRVGAMYDDFWTAIMESPVPPRPDLSAADRAFFASEYRRNLASLVKPLLRHAIRYWELTLMLVERTGVHTDWEDRARQDLERVRGRLLEDERSSAATDSPTAPSAPSGGTSATSPQPPAPSPAPSTPSGG